MATKKRAAKAAAEREYLLVGHVAATVYQRVKASSPEAAYEEQDMGMPGLCWQCSDKVELGDIYRVQVVADSGNGDVVYDDDPDLDRVADLKEHIAILEARLRESEAELARLKGKVQP